MATQKDQSLSVGLSRRLGDLLVEKGIITNKQLQDVLAQQRETGGKLGSLLVQKGYIDEEVLLSFLSKQCGISYVVLSEQPLPPEEVLKCVPESIARRHVLIPIEKTGNTLTVALGDPLNVLVLDDLKMMTGFEIKPALASETDINQAIEKAYGKQSSQEVLDEILQASGEKEAGEVGLVEESDDKGGGQDITAVGGGEEGPIIQMVNLIIAQAIRAKASDIHIEPYVKNLRVRYRIDGVLHEQPAPPKRFLNAIVSRLKVMSNLDISERRIPQDGRIKISLEKKEIDLRLSILPCAPGEKVVMRILDSSGLKVKISDLGFEPETLAQFEKSIAHPHGIILITGPTGSGKSTTLYSALQTLNDSETNIVTVEDPVEYQLPGINQVSVNTEVGLTFAAGLRSFLRQDPDIIMVGEIRDPETMGIAMNAAMTGHLVFSTLHTNDAPGALTRITMMGIEPFLISSTVLMVMAQRLVRRVCPKCLEHYEVDAQWLAKLGVKPEMFSASAGKVQLTRGKGCDHCAKTGYRGRAGIHEILEMNDEVRHAISERANSTAIKEVARKHGMMTLRESAIRKMLAGVTTVEEMLRVTASDVD
jgi:type IV pilus assembly protein PilB